MRDVLTFGFTVSGARGNWHAYVVRYDAAARIDAERNLFAGERLSTGRGRNRLEAVREAVKLARMAMRLERDERARLALSLAPKLTALAVKAGAL